MKTATLCHIGGNLILLQKIPSYQIFTSPNESVIMSSNCSSCLRNVACGSKIQAGSKIAIIPNCPDNQEWQNSQPPAHLLNLQVLAPLLDEQLLQELSAEYTFANQINMKLPNITIFSPTDDQQLGHAFQTLDTPTIHLTTAINQSLSHEMVFKNSRDHIIYKIREQGIGYKVRAGWKSFKNFFSNPFQILTKALTFLQWIALAYLFIEFKF